MGCPNWYSIKILGGCGSTQADTHVSEQTGGWELELEWNPLFGTRALVPIPSLPTLRNKRQHDELAEALSLSLPSFWANPDRAA